MGPGKLYRGLLTALALSLLGAQAQAATVLQMNLEELVDRAHRVFRGTVLDVREGKIDAGGAELPTVTYRLRVEEAFKGTFSEIKGVQIAEITMIGKLKGTHGAVQEYAPSTLLEVPRLEVGRDYLLLNTAPSTIGLSTTVGLGQGCFRVTGKAGQELAVNLNQNLGLLNGMEGSGFAAGPSSSSGPLSYDLLAGLIRDIVD